MLKEQQEILVNGVWMIVDEMIDTNTAWCIDQEGGEHEITADMVDHYYTCYRKIEFSNAMSVKQVRDAELRKKYGSNEPIDDEGFFIKCRD